MAARLIAPPGSSQPSTPAAAGEMAALLGNEHTHLSALLDLLQKEQDLLVSGARERAAQYIEAKSTRLLELSRLAERRHTLLRRHDFSADRKGFASLLAATPVPSSVHALWKDIVRMARRAHEINRLNGLLIEAGLAANQKAIGVLHAAANIGTLYGADGRPKARVSTRNWFAA